MPENTKIIIEVDEEELTETQGKRTDLLRMLSFRLGDENYCVDIEQVREVVRLKEITAVPNTPEYVLGVVNLRGEIISLIDMRHFLGLESRGVTDESRILLTDVVAEGSGSFRSEKVGILFDRINGVMDIEPKAIQPPLATIEGKRAEFTRGQVDMGDSINILLDLTRVMDCEEIRMLKGGE